MKLSAALFVVTLLAKAYVARAGKPNPNPVVPCEVAEPGLNLCEPCCHCIPDDPDDMDTCPDIGDRMTAAAYAMDGTTIAKFLSYELVDDLEKFPIPSIDDCQPYPAVAGATQVPLCPDPEEEDGDMCAFVYKKGDTCEERDEYTLKTLSASEAAQAPDNYVVTHEGACGVCSSAQDLAANLNPGLNVVSFLCGLIIPRGIMDGASTPEAFRGLIEATQQCFIEEVGFSSDCAFLFASNAFNTNAGGGNPTMSCTPACVNYLGLCTVPPLEQQPTEACINAAVGGIFVPPEDQSSCMLNDCLTCDENISGDVFAKFAGRTRRNSGILTVAESPLPPPPMTQITTGFVGFKRPCSSLADLAQDPCAGASDGGKKGNSGKKGHGFYYNFGKKSGSMSL